MHHLRSLGAALNKRRGPVAFAVILVGAFVWLIVATTGHSPPSTGEPARVPTSVATH